MNAPIEGDDPYRRNAWRGEPPESPSLAAVIVGVLLGLASIYSVTSLAACTTHVLGPTDTAALRDSLELEARIYCGSDGGMVRAFARGAFLSDRDVLARSGVVIDAGPACAPGGVPR